jgi:excisionase family DNA binding protein
MSLRRQSVPELTAGMAAARLGVSLSTLRRWADQGALPSSRSPGGQRRFRAEDLAEFVELAPWRLPALERVGGQFRAIETASGTYPPGDFVAELEVRGHMLRALAVELQRIYMLSLLTTVGEATHANLRALRRAFRDL